MESLGDTRQSDRMRQIYFKRLSTHSLEEKTDKQLVALVLEHAKKVIAHPSRPMLLRTDSFARNPFADLAIEETLEENPFLDNPEDLIVQFPEEKPFSCVAMLDTSSSMSGDKHLLASIAVAVLILEVPSVDHSVVVFNSDSKPIKKMAFEEKVEETLLRFLKVQPRGFTNLALGLETGIKELQGQATTKRKIGLLATDGRTTEGKDPLEVAKQFDFLVVLHLCGPGSDLSASQEIAQAGHGICLEVEKFEDLPHRLYESLRMLARLA
ncbi:MAG: VWA domain-containing protein [Proteobacteria bacterium]|nr:VWA domain-containing protein [Pseudomonadota bacterium]